VELFAFHKKRVRIMYIESRDGDGIESHEANILNIVGICKCIKGYDQNNV
jgi:hypothetical protein